KTGIGHYTAQLVEHLRALPGDQEVATFPPAWFRTFWKWRKRLVGPGKVPPEAPVVLAARVGLKSRLQSRLRRAGHNWVARQLRGGGWACRRGTCCTWGRWSRARTWRRWCAPTPACRPPPAAPTPCCWWAAGAGTPPAWRGCWTRWAGPPGWPTWATCPRPT